MVRTVGLGLPQQHPLPSASATSSTSTPLHLQRHLEAPEQMRPPTPSTSTLEMLLSDAFDEFDDSNEESATFSLHAIPPSSSSSASTLEARYSLNDSGHIDPLVFDAIDRAIAVVSPNDYSIGISAETNNLYHMAPCAPHLAPRAPHLAPCAPHLAPCAPHLAPCAPHLALCAPHLAPCAPHLAPCARHTHQHVHHHRSTTTPSPHAPPKSSSFPLLLALWEGDVSASIAARPSDRLAPRSPPRRRPSHQPPPRAP